MSELSNHTRQCILPSELDPKQLDSLPFSLGGLTSFDEKKMLPPTARPQWSYVQLNPEEFLTRFAAELGLLGINIAVCFINNDHYEDRDKDLKTPITVNLIVREEHFQELKKHLEDKRLSHQVLKENMGFALPYLGSVQNAIDAMALDSLMNYVFIKNSISRESYATWLSIPQAYLDNLARQAAAKKSTLKSVLKEVDPETESEPQKPSESTTQNSKKEDFNYVIYDEEEENESEAERKIPAKLVKKPKTKKESFLHKYFSKSKPETTQASGPNPTAKLDSSLFLSLGLFNFHCSIILVAFLLEHVESLRSAILELVSISMLVSLLFAYMVLRPSLKDSASRIWSLAAYTGYFGITGFQIYYIHNFPNSLNFITPAAIAGVCLVTAALSGFFRIDRLSMQKAKAQAAEAVTNSKESQKEEKKQTAKSKAKPVSKPQPKARKFPPPVKPVAKKAETKRIELKRSSSKSESGFSETVSAGTVQGPAISELQKQEITNRISRKNRISLSTVSKSSDSDTPSPQKLRDDDQPLSSQEIRAKLASGIAQVKAVTQNGPASEVAETSKSLPPD